LEDVALFAVLLVTTPLHLYLSLNYKLQKVNVQAVCLWD
jgi:hypothetical protein